MNRDTDRRLALSVDRELAQSVQVDSSESTLADYALICKEHVWLIGGCGVVLAGIAYIWASMQIPIYQAKATVVIEREGPDAIEREKSYYQSDVSPEYFQTQFELMKSRLVLQRTAQVLHLSDQPEFRPQQSAIKSMFLNMVPAAIRDAWGAKKEMAGLSPEVAEDRLLRRFAQNVEIMPIRGARLADIFALSEDPQFAAQIANTLASVYIDRTQELNAQTKEKSAQWLTTHVDQLRAKAEASQQALYAFRAKHGLLGSRDRQAMTAQTNTELDSELVKAEMKKAEAQSRIEQIRSVLRNKTDKNGVIEIDWSSLEASTEVLSSPLIQTLRAQEIKASGQVAELTDKYGPLHPKLARAKAELGDLRERIRQEVEKIFDSVKREYDASLGRVRVIRESAARHRQEKIKLEQVEIEYGSLEREAESSQHLFDLFLKQAKEADILAGVRSANVYLADPAVPSSIVFKPKKELNTLLGLLLGLMTGAAYVVGFKTRDQRLNDPSDLERWLPSTSVLGVMPVMSKAEVTHGQLLLASQGATAAAESVRIIRTNMLFSKTGDLPSCVLITSPGEGEGKTTLAVSLSAAQAQLEDVRVLLINADLRTRIPHEIFRPKEEGNEVKGLIDFLNGQASIEEIIYPTAMSNLFMIPGGGHPWNPAELLQSKRMRLLLQHCREEGFHIIIDAPPVLPVADALIVASIVDGVLLVVGAKQTTSEACRLAVQRVRGAGGKILGVVMQKTAKTESPYFFYGGYPA
jgi:capsular exopolysaccharide synthesis family protein